MDDNFKDFLYANNLINSTNDFIPINVTRHPSRFPADKVVEAQKLQKIMNTLLYRAIKDDSTYKLDTKDEMYNMLVKMRRSNDKSKLTLLYTRTDYLLDQNHILKQVEINTIAASFLELNSRLNNVHALLYENVWLPDNVPRFVKMVMLTREIFIRANGYDNLIALLFDDDTGLQSKNFFEKKNLIYELRKNGVKMLHVTIDDVEKYGKFENNRFIYGDKNVFFIYFRYFYNYDHYNDEFIQLRKKIEDSDAITLPSIELQIVGLKMFQVVFKNRNVLGMYLDDTQANCIYEHFGEFKSVKDYKFGDEKGYFLKCMREGGNTIITENFKDYLAEPDKYFLMKKINSITVKNRFYTEENDVDMVLELGILGTLIEDAGKIILNEDSGFICRSKKVESNECGVTCNHGGLDSIYKN